MKRNTYHLSAALALLLGLAACTQDELSSPRGEWRGSHRLHRHGAEPRGDSRRRHPCPRGRQLGGRHLRGSPDWRHCEGVRRDAHHRRQHQRHADLHRPALLGRPQRHARHGLVALHRGRDRNARREGTSTPEHTGRLRGQRLHRRRGAGGELRQPHAPLHPPHGAGDRRPDGPPRGVDERVADGPLHRERKPGCNRPV